MIISQGKYATTMARALMKGYFLGIEEERKRGVNRRMRRLLALIFKRRGAVGRKSTIS